jgi:outer membrane protein assembly factor BamB
VAPYLLAVLLVQDSPIPLPNDVTRLHDLGGRILAAGRDNLFVVDPAAWKIVANTNVNTSKGERFIGVAGGLAITTSNDAVQAYGPDLKPKWKSPSKLYAAEAVEVSGGILVIVQDRRSTGGGVAHSARLLDPAGGAVRAELDPGFANSWVWRVEKDLILFGEKEKEETDDATATAFDGAGKRLWSAKLGKFRRLAVGARTLVVGRPEPEGGMTLRAIDLRAGSDLFSMKVGAAVGCGGSAGDLVFLFEQAGYSGTRLTALDAPAGGKERWSVLLPVAPRRAVEVAGALVVETSRATTGLDPSNGAKRWEFRRKEIFRITAVGADIFVPVVALDKPCVMLAEAAGRGGAAVSVVEAEGGAVRREIEVPDGLRTALLLGSRLVMSVDLKLVKVELGGK